jgi:hypothetical protein
MAWQRQVEHGVAVDTRVSVEVYCGAWRKPGDKAREVYRLRSLKVVAFEHEPEDLSGDVPTRRGAIRRGIAEIATTSPADDRLRPRRDRHRGRTAKDPRGDHIRFAFWGVAGRVECADAGRVDRPSALLHNVSQLMGEQPPAVRRGGRIASHIERDITADGVGNRIDAPGGLRGCAISVDAHVGKAVAECGLHERAGTRV